MRSRLAGLLVLALLASSCAAEPLPRQETSPTPAQTAVGSTVSQTPTASDVPYLQDGRLWLRGLRASSSDVVSPKIAADSEGAIVVGITVGYSEGPADADLGGGVLEGIGETDVVIGKLSSDGSHLWSRLVGGTGTDYTGGVALTREGAIALAGTFEDSVDFGGATLTSEGGRDAFLSLLDGHGQLIWARGFGGPGFTSGSRLASLPGGGFALAGSFAGVIDFGTGPLTASGASETYGDLFVTRLDATGSPLWVRQLGVAGWPTGLTIDEPTGDIVVSTAERRWPEPNRDRVGSTLTRVSASGEALWTRRFDVEGAAHIEGVAISPEGEIVITGTFEEPAGLGGEVLSPNGLGRGYVRTYPDGFLARLTSGGEHLWSVRFGGTYIERAQAVAITARGDILVAGRFGGELELGVGVAPVREANSGAGYIARFDPDGKPLEVKALAETQQITSLGGLIADAPAAEDGEILVSGRFFDWLDLGFGRLRTSHWLDFFIARIRQP